METIDKYLLTRAKIHNVFSEVSDSYVNRMLQHAKNQRSNEMPYRWDTAKPLPDVMEGYFQNCLTETREDISLTEWILFDKNGNSTIINPSLSVGWSNVGGKRTFIRNTPDTMPSYAVRAIRVTLGARNTYYGTEGIRWELFSKYPLVD